MEIMNGFTDQQKPAITSNFTLKIYMIVIADTTFLTIMQKKENRSGRLSLDNIEMQVGYKWLR